MAASAFSGLTLIELTELRTSIVQGIKDIVVGGQSYSLSGRTFTRANLKELRDLLQDVNGALGNLSGTRTSIAQARIC